jgi:hypothetical protein
MCQEFLLDRCFLGTDLFLFFIGVFMNSPTTIQCKLLSDAQRVTHTAKLFGISFPMLLEPFVFNMAGKLSRDYSGGLWAFYSLSNGGFYLAPESPDSFTVSSENGYQCSMAADALGITACLYAYSHLSFRNLGVFSETCARQYHLLLEYAFDHDQAERILGVID